MADPGGSAQIREVNVGPVRIQNRQACTFQAQQLNRAIQDLSGYFCKIGPGIDVVSDLEQRLVYSPFLLLFGVDLGVPVADRDLVGPACDALAFLFDPVVVLPAVVQPDYAHRLVLKHHRDQQRRLRAHQLGNGPNYLRQMLSRRILDYVGLEYVKPVLEPGDINRDSLKEGRRLAVAVIGAEFMGDPKLAAPRENHYVAAV